MRHRKSSIRGAGALLYVVLAAGLLVPISGCNNSTPDRTSAPRERTAEDDGPKTSQRSAALGESSQAYTFDGDGGRPIPGYNERLALHVMNRFRLHPGHYGIQTMQGPVPPNRPMIGDPGLVEAGRWQARHGLRAECECPQLQPSPSMPGQGACCLPDSAEKACEITTQGNCSGQFRAGTGCEQAGCPNFPPKNSCCPITKKNGKVQCEQTSKPLGKIKCKDEKRATDEKKRWALLESGSAAIQNELYQVATAGADEAPSTLPGSVLACWAVGGCSPPSLALQPPQPFLRDSVTAMGVGQVRKPVVPDDCKPPQDPCKVGTCTDLQTGKNVCDEDQNPDCTGACKGPACDGVCKEQNADTGTKEPVACELPKPPDPDKCKPSKYDKKFYVSYVHGNTDEPIPTLVDGIHYKLGLYTPDGLLDKTSSDKIGFGVHYYEPAGDAQSANVVVGGNCNSLQVEKRNVQMATTATSGHVDAGVISADASSSDAGDTAVGPSDTSGSSGDVSSSDTSSSDTASSDTTTDTSSPSDTRGGSDTAPADTANGDTGGPGGDTQTADADAAGDTSGGSSNYYGLRYGTEVDLQPGCHRYVFSFTDADGFIHTYPRYGSLGAKIAQIQGDNGMITAPVPNDDKCPIWSPKRPSMSCLPKGDQCVQGETQQCYTGRANTRGKGICKLGTEQCKNGRWSGVCKNEVTPKPDEKCGDKKDNDCNGYTDENCGGGGGDAGMGDAGPDAGADTNGMPDTGGDAGGPIDGGDAAQTDDEDEEATRGCGGCASGAPGAPLAPAGLIFALGALAVRLRSGRAS